LAGPLGDVAGDFYASADGGGGFAQAAVGELFVVDAGDFDVDVYAVEEWA
jgi:hypothetical protein